METSYNVAVVRYGQTQRSNRRSFLVKVSEIRHSESCNYIFKLGYIS